MFSAESARAVSRVSATPTQEAALARAERAIRARALEGERTAELHVPYPDLVEATLRHAGYTVRRCRGGLRVQW